MIPKHIHRSLLICKLFWDDLISEARQLSKILASRAIDIVYTTDVNVGTTTLDGTLKLNSQRNERRFRTSL